MIPYEITTLDVVETFINAEEPLFSDTETKGFYGSIRLVQFFQEGWDQVLLVEHPNPFALAIMLDKYKSVWHNSHYDITTIQCNLNAFWEPKEYHDTFYLSRLHYYSKHEFDLESIFTYALGFDPYAAEGLNKAALQNSDWGALVLTDDQKTYAALDVYFMPEVWNKVKSFTADTSYKLDMLSLHYALEFQTHGLPVLPKEVQDQYKKNLDAIQELNVPINVNSYVQVRKYIGSNKSDALGLATLALQGNLKAKAVLTARRLIKQNSFLDKFDVEEKIIYGKFKPSARSGRFTCADQNLEQIPRKLKHVFGTEEDSGEVLITADYAQLEMRTITAITGELKLQRLLKENGDVHSYTAEMIFGPNFTKEQRQIAKTANFNLLYGGGAPMFQSILIKDAMLFLQEFECRNIKYKWLNLWVAIAAWQKQGINDYHHNLPWETPLGRRYVAKLMTDQLNIKNQGAGAEVAKLAMHYMYDPIKEKFNNTVKMRNFVHDNYVYSAPKDPAIYMAAAKLIAEKMQLAWFEFLTVAKNLKCRDIPMPVDVFVGHNLGTMEKEPLYKFQLEGYEFS